MPQPPDGTKNSTHCTPLPSDDPCFAFERLVVCTGLSLDGNTVRCRFAQLDTDCTMIMGKLTAMGAAKYLLANRATFTIPDGNMYWENTPGEYKMHFEGLKRVLNKKTGLHVWTVFATVVDSSDPSDIGLEEELPCYKTHWIYNPPAAPPHGCGSQEGGGMDTPVRYAQRERP